MSVASAADGKSIVKNEADRLASVWRAGGVRYWVGVYTITSDAKKDPVRHVIRWENPHNPIAEERVFSEKAYPWLLRLYDAKGSFESIRFGWVQETNEPDAVEPNPKNIITSQGTWIQNKNGELPQQWSPSWLKEWCASRKGVVIRYDPKANPKPLKDTQQAIDAAILDIDKRVGAVEP